MPAPLSFSGKNGQLYANGQPFHVKGISYYGTEHKLDHPPFGLDKHSLDYYFSWLAKEKFNAVRLFSNHEAVMRDLPIP